MLTYIPGKCKWSVQTKGGVDGENINFPFDDINLGVHLTVNYTDTDS